ncbi:hypothetical protein Z042_14270 [Chania multitudinisentens RB-25]|uniref:Plasmid stabilization protein n=1 Tax=Chania multitudinisentens RB-25 TaxID=1441930 RepID=W0LFD2_9GAMM|nr:plasmid partitioning/stability family protein [Chania multitudinisentens]AHG20655.1 hypothetical protein Z042_14270 [Chania multitudinisentens RB-25]
MSKYSKRKKIIAYLHPEIYLQDQLTQHYVECLPVQVRGEFYRQSIICGAALSSVDPRLVNLISSFFNGSITAENIIKLIEQAMGCSPGATEERVISYVASVSENKIKPGMETTEKKAIKNLSMLKK